MRSALTPLLPLIRVTDLRKLLEIEDETATAQRLGYALATAGKAELANVIHNWLPVHQDYWVETPPFRAALVCCDWT